MFPFLNHFDPAKDGAVRSRARQWVQEQKELKELSRANEAMLLKDTVSCRSEGALSNTSGKIHPPSTLKAAATSTTEPIRRLQSNKSLR